MGLIPQNKDVIIHRFAILNKKSGQLGDYSIFKSSAIQSNLSGVYASNKLQNLAQ